MNVNLMRFIDRYVGIPLAFVLTCVTRLISIFSPEKKVKPEKILFIELSEMGSTILADPAMRKAQKAFGAELFFCIFAKNKNSLRLLNTVAEKNVFVIRENNFITLVCDSIKFLSWTKKNKIDTVVDLELFARITAILTGLSGAKNRVGFFPFHSEGLYRGNMLTHKVLYNSHIHIAKNFIALINALMPENEEVPYSKTFVDDEEIKLEKVFPDKDEQDDMWELAKKEYPALDREKHHIVLVDANASDLLPQRKWPFQKFAGLVKKILEYDGAAVVLVTGSPIERDDMQSLVDMVGDERCINFAGNLELQELPVLYSIATLMVTNDSGPAHFSAVTDMPAFVLFGPETPDLYGALGNSTSIYAHLACSPCVSASNQKKTPCKDNRCLKVISEDMVFEKVKPLLRA